MLAPPVGGAAVRPEDPGDDFFRLTAAEAQSMSSGAARRREEGQQLTTRAWKEKQARERAGGAARPPSTSALLRVRLPGGMLLQASFKAAEPTSALRQFVAESLTDQTAEFELFSQPGRRALPEAGSLLDAGLAPAALLNMALVCGDATLTPELLAVAEQL